MKKLIPLLFSILLIGSTYSQPGGGDGCIRIIGVDPNFNFITIVNLTTAPVDISGHRLCSLFNYATLSNLTASFGDVSNVPANDIVIVSWPIDDSAADLALYLPTGSFSDPSAMVDFMQYGSAGNGREDEAVEAGLWTAGDFIPQAAIYVWVGACTDHSSANWNPTNVESLNSENIITIAPNPVAEQFQMNMTSTLNTDGVLRLWDSQGKICLEQKVDVLSGENVFNVNVNHLAEGHYLMMLIADGLTPKPIHVIRED